MNAGLPLPAGRSRRSYRLYRAWLLFPFIWQAGLAGAVNDVAWRPFGLPFPMAWQLAGIVLTSLALAWVFRRDRQTGVDAEEASFLAASVAATALTASLTAPRSASLAAPRASGSSPGREVP